MPQQLNKYWQEELGNDFENIHKTYLHNIGNLILTEFNSEMGNKSFEEKKTKLKTSALFYRLDIIDIQEWNENSIIIHQEKMINYFLETFSLPDEYKIASNWNTTVIECTTFSPLDKDASELAEGNKPAEIIIFNEKFEVNTWQDVFLKFIEQTQLNDKFDFDYIFQNQMDLFNGNDILIKWEKLKDIINGNDYLSGHYKNLKGKTYLKMTKLKNDELFLHTNISSYTCLLRIANIMNKFNIYDNDIVINLKV